MTNHTVLLAGATGMLGGRIAHHMLQTDGVTLRSLIRPDALDDVGKRDQLDDLRRRGAEQITGDLSRPEDLERATDDVVVSALQGDRDVIVDGQIALARAAAANGVGRFLPSDYATDLFKATAGEHHPSDLRREADTQIASLGMDVVHVLNGPVLDGIALPGPVIEIDDQAKTGTFWGTGDEPFQATTIENTSRGSLDDLRGWTQQQRDSNNEQMATIGTYHTTACPTGQRRTTTLWTTAAPRTLPCSGALRATPSTPTRTWRQPIHL